MPSKCSAEVHKTPIGKRVVKKLQIKNEKIQNARKIQNKLQIQRIQSYPK